MNPLIKPENIRIYRQANGTYTIQPKGTYVPWLSHFDRLTSLTVSIHHSVVEAKKDIESTWKVALPQKLPFYFETEYPHLPNLEGIPGFDRMTVSVEDLVYLGLYLCTVSIVGINSSQLDREGITYEDFLPKIIPPIHHQILSAFNDFCRNAGQPVQPADYQDSFGRFYTRFWWNGNGVEVVLANLSLHDERRGTGLLKELIGHLKSDSRVHLICIEQVRPEGLKRHLQTLGFHEDSAKPSNFILSRSESWN